MNILLVDDEYQKAQEIAAVLGGADIKDLNIRHDTTASAARLTLRGAKFDLLIIDLNLPDAIGASPTNEGGLDFFDLISLDENVILPEDVLFITAREELVNDAAAKVLERGAVLCQYKTGSTEWQKVLLGRTSYVVKRIQRRSSLDLKADIAVITAMRTPELDAVLSLPYGWVTKRMHNVPTTFHTGLINTDSKHLKIVAASAHRKGMPSAAALAMKLTMMCRPRYLIMLGICAGVKGKTNLGDVIVADPAWDWGSGKKGQDVEGTAVFQAAPYQLPLSTTVSQLAVELSKDPKIKQAIRAGWEESVPEGIFDIHVGPMASGASVIADDNSARFIVTQHKELLGIEMEAYAVMAAAEYAEEPRPIACAIKSVCDYADSKKGDDWQKYAAYTSAAFADHLFRSKYFHT